MRHHDGTRLRSNRFDQRIRVNRVIAQVYIYKNGNELVLQDGRDRCGKPGCDGDDFIAWL